MDNKKNPREEKEPEKKVNKPGDLSLRLDEISLLQDQLIKLKQDYVGIVASASEDSLEEDEATFLLLRSHGALFALPIAFVEEVLQMTALVQLPQEVSGVKGLANFHGEMLAVIDFNELADKGTTAVLPDNVMVVCTAGSLKFAVMFDDAADVITISKSDFQVTDEVLPGVLRAAGLLQVSNETAIIVDVWSVALSVQLEEINKDVENTSTGNGFQGE